MRRVRWEITLVLVVFTVQVTAFVQVTYAAGVQGHWADQLLVESEVRRVLFGYPDGSLRPDYSITRAEFAAIVCRAVGEKENVTVAARILPVFDDLQSDHWAVGYMRVLFEMGLFEGDDDGRSRPDDPISRAEAALIGSRLFTYLSIQAGSSIAVSFSDSGEIPTWAQPAVAMLSGVGVLKGNDQGLFRPNESISRAEGIAIVARLLDMAGLRWQIVGTVIGFDKEKSSIRVRSALGNEVVLRCNEASLVFVDGLRGTFDSLRIGAITSVICDDEKPSIASVISIE